MKKFTKGIYEEFSDSMKDAFKGGLKSNKAINADPIKHAKGFATGLGDSIYNARHAKVGIKEAVKAAHTTADGSLSIPTIAGSYIVGTSALRLAGGGGLYKDKDGNTNLMGIPFI